MGRRAAIAGLGATVGALAAGRASAAVPVRAMPGIVDVHHHFYPKFLIDAWASAPLGGDWAAYKTLFMQPPYSAWTPEGAIDLLDANGIATAVLSLPAGTVGFLKGAEQVRMVRRINEFAVRLEHDRPGRFGLFALLPMPDIAGSLAEISYALDELGATGIALMTSYGNRWLGHPDFTAILEELDRRGAVVHVHPKAPPCCTNLVQSNPWGEASLLEFPFDTGRTMFDLLQSGAFVRFRRIQWIFSHIGGVIPILAGRLRDVGPGFWRDLDKVAPQGIDHEFQRVHYDTAASAYEPSMRAALAYLPVERLLFGTDYPHYDVARTVAGFDRLSMGKRIKTAIQRDNAPRLPDPPARPPREEFPMKRALRILSKTLLIGGTLFASSALIAQTLVIDRVTVVDVRTGKLVANRAIVIVAGKITRIAAAGTVKSRGPHVDGKGAFVVPGYNDMHAHNLNTDSPETSLPIMLASGITGFRQMAGSPQLLAARAKGTLGLPADSPALLAMPGTIIAGPAFADSAAVTAEIARQKAQGADFIKVVDLPRATFLAAADAAHAADLPYAGHLPPTVDTRDALAHGMASIEHLGPGISLLINCSRDEATIRAILANIPVDARGIDFTLPPAQLRRLLANPMLLNPPPAFLLMRRVLSTYDDAKCRAFAADVAKSKTWMVPTLTRLEAMNLGNAPDLRDNPDLALVPADVRQLWRDVGIDFDTKLTPDQRQTLADLFKAQLRLTKLFDASGVKMVAGTDFGGQWIAPNALHREFDLLARAGVPPLRILRMATLGPAQFLKREVSMGTVEPGRNADLVLLTADPTKRADALHTVTGVVRGGRYLGRAELDAIQSKVSAALR